MLLLYCIALLRLGLQLHRHAYAGIVLINVQLLLFLVATVLFASFADRKIEKIKTDSTLLTNHSLSLLTDSFTYLVFFPTLGSPLFPSVDQLLHFLA